MKNVLDLHLRAAYPGSVHAEHSVIKNKYVEKTPERQETLQKCAITRRKSTQSLPTQTRSSAKGIFHLCRALLFRIFPPNPGFTIHTLTFNALKAKAPTWPNAPCNPAPAAVKLL
ncbi:hypothetical protein [Neopusillimonas aromaticivorans]|uniref:hypothetical protein n=1 Tax=Neopusillimonas aromaticivorans TaxID=2979868 RepID=UPI002596EEEE|nr:hypothetical protein [Neopusillimonas aromaticivorans]WJJ94278.1 hypothetical protein N7E01_04325 [Neopusillimonas aromaticivorans]